jgi:site-specific recombinase XerD
LRRTFAVQTLRNGANVFSVQTMLGHTDLQMTRRYCAIAHADVETQHRQYGPVDHLEFIPA